MKRKLTQKPTAPKSCSTAEAEKHTVCDLFPKLVQQANPLTPHPLPAEEYPQIRLRKQNNFMSQWIDFA